MGFLMDSEKAFVNDNVFLHEDRINSQYSRFLEQSPTYTTYYNISQVESTTDTGFLGVERILGTNSPVRFNKVKSFPIYGIEQIVMNLSQEDQGIDSSYDGEGIILPHTIHPLPNDVFTIEYLDQGYVFMVTEIAYDTIKSNSYYRVMFTVKSLSGAYKDDLIRQTVDDFTCVVDNIGTEEKVLIKDDDIRMLHELDTVYGNIAQHYKTLFFNSKYNAFLLNEFNGRSLYDKYLSEFVNRFGLFNEKRRYETFHLTNEDKDRLMGMEYHNSIYRALELKRKDLIKPTTYTHTFITNQMSIFVFHRDARVMSTKLGQGANLYISDELRAAIEGNLPDTVSHPLEKLLVGFFNDSVSTIQTLSLDELNDFMGFMDYDHKTFVLGPIALFILRMYYMKFMSAT